MSKSLSFTDAAEKVLKECADKKPMHYRKIFQLAKENKWISTEGLTPEITLTTVINLENRRKLRRGEEPRFVAHGEGLYGLSEWEPKGLLGDIQKRNKEVKQELCKRMMKILPERFEELISQLLIEVGFENVEVTKRSGDDGIDVKGELIVGDIIKTKIAVQVKRWKKNVPPKVVTQLRGSLKPHEHEQGLIITTSDFSKRAVEEASAPGKTPIALMNGEKLMGLMAEYRIGIKEKEEDLRLLAIDEEFLSKMGIKEE